MFSQGMRRAISCNQTRRTLQLSTVSRAGPASWSARSTKQEEHYNYVLYATQDFKLLDRLMRGTKQEEHYNAATSPAASLPRPLSRTKQEEHYNFQYLVREFLLGVA